MRGQTTIGLLLVVFLTATVVWAEGNSDPRTTWQVTNLLDSGPGSLRSAIDSANANPGPDEITFTVSGTIYPATPLPALTDDGTVILGGSAPGGKRSVILDGTGGDANHGLEITSNSNVITDLVFTEWFSVCVFIAGRDNCVAGCYIGLNAAGDDEASMGTGIEIQGSNNYIGRRDDAYDANYIISFMGAAGIKILGDSNTVAKGNFIGLNASRTAGVGVLLNSFGIWLSGADYNTIGGDYPDIMHNWICNQGNAIYLVNSSYNTITGNVIGLNGDGDGAIRNMKGIILEGASQHNLIGDSLKGNYVSGNMAYGIALSQAGTDYNIVQGNVIGLDLLNGDTLGNRIAGIYIADSASHNLIGGYYSNGVDETQANFICATSGDGIEISNDSDSNMVIGNKIGVDFAGRAAGNVGDGVHIIYRCDYNSIDSNVIANNCYGVTVENESRFNTISRNLIYDNDDRGIDLRLNGNELLNFPVVDSAVSRLDGSYDIYGTAPDSSRVELFVAHPAGQVSQAADPSGHGEAYRYLGYAMSAATGVFSMSVPSSVGYFSVVTTTATDSLGNTSEFSLNTLLVPRPLIVVAYSPVNIIITDPDWLLFGKDSLGNDITGIPDGHYFITPNDSVIIDHPKPGNYTIGFVTEAGTPPGATFSAIIKIDGTDQVIIATDILAPTSGTTDDYNYEVEEGFTYVNGDANRDGVINIGDAVFIVNYVFRGGAAPDPVTAADANCDWKVNVGDAVYLVNYIFRGGPAPCCP